MTDADRLEIARSRVGISSVDTEVLRNQRVSSASTVTSKGKALKGALNMDYFYARSTKNKKRPDA